MTIDELFDSLSEKYGEEFDWSMISSERARDSFVRELKGELGENDELFRGKVSAFARCEANDDVLFLTEREGSEAKWRVYHLTWSARNAAGHPRYEELADTEAVGRYIEGRLG